MAHGVAASDILIIRVMTIVAIVFYTKLGWLKLDRAIGIVVVVVCCNSNSFSSF